MFASRWVPAARLNASQARGFSLLSTHTTFPATMYRFQLSKKATLYDANQEETRYRKDGIRVSENGLVHANISKSSPYSNGPIFMPNSRLLQQMLKFDFAHYQEETSDGKCPLDPSVICVQKGTPIPSALVMWREGISRFSLQPSEPTEIDKLNELLSNFYESSATVFGAQEWIEKHPYKESLPDQNEADWMKS
ncbi:unnamed protein product [Penicillium olsonii]|uniref:Tse2 ADP-ribosyltransferase toxin domain-containing protein n=1 Tax=Penicillium olsonii TaxID=99116 RepID=A0A9W4I226_PENOL|nr:unnamed protein product [Penicillium olsonii]CAG8218749.1 unnamed protein product [Penicillium olsonii]CAG8278782.1 unnamed protein product [Penicillium olsonii]